MIFSVDNRHLRDDIVITMLNADDTAEKLTTQIRIRPDTRKRLDRITDESGWTITEAVERAVGELEKRLGHSPRKRSGRASAA